MVLRASVGRVAANYGKHNLCKICLWKQLTTHVSKTRRLLMTRIDRKSRVRASAV